MASSHMIVTRHGDGRVTADGFPECIKMSAELLECADPQYLDTSDEAITFRLSNGTASYRVVDTERGGDVLICRRVTLRTDTGS